MVIGIAVHLREINNVIPFVKRSRGSMYTNANPFPCLAGVLVSPYETFKAIGQKPTLITPILTAILIAIIGNAFYYWRVGPDWDQRVRARIESHRVTTGETMSSDQVAQQVATAKMFGNFFVLLPAISIPVFCLAIAGLYLLAFGMAFLKAPPFKTILSVVAWSEAAIKLVGVPMIMIVLLAVDRQELNKLDPASSKPLKSNLSILLPEGFSPTIKSLAASLDIFTIWFLVLLTIGFAGIAGLAPRNIATSKIAILVFGMWLTWVLIKACLVFLFGY